MVTMRYGRTEEGSPRRIAEALHGREAVDADRHPGGSMRARARRLIRKAKAGDGALRGAADGA